MGIIGTVALGFGVNILTNISVAISSFASDKIKQKKILHKLSDFNSNFENTSIDTNTFSDIIESDYFSDMIYSYVFKNLESTSSKDEFIILTTDYLVEKINQENQIHRRAIFEDRETVILYIESLIGLLIEIRNSNFNDNDLQLISTINISIVENREIIVEEVKQQFKLNQLDNQFAEKVIEDLIKHNLRFEFEVAEETYEKLIANKSQISNSQLLRISVEYAKTCAFRDEYMKISKIIQDITSLSNSEKYIYEIKYIKSLRLKEKENLVEYIDYFKSQHYSSEVIALKICEIQKALGDYDSLKNEILDEEYNLKINFTDFPDAHFYRGLYLCICKNTIDIKDFDIASTINDSKLYLFYKTLITIKNHIKILNSQKLNDLYEDFLNFEKYLKYFDEQEQLNYWMLAFPLDNILNLNKLNYFEDVLKQNDFYKIPMLKSALAEAYGRNNNYSKALEILENYSEKSQDDTILLFDFLFHLNEWDRITKEYDLIINQNNKDIKLIYHAALFMINSSTEEIKKIVDICEETNNISCYYKAIKFISKYSKEDFKFLFKILQKNIFDFDINTQTFLIDLIFMNNYTSEAQSLILLLPILNNSLISILVSTMNLTEDKKVLAGYKIIIDELTLKYTLIELLVFSIQLDLELRIITHQTFNNINKLKEITTDVSMVSYFNLSAKYLVDDLEDIEEDIKILINSQKPHEKIIAAIILVKTNQLDLANRLAIETLYNNKDNIDEHLTMNFLSIINQQLGSIYDSCTPPSIDSYNIVLNLKSSNSSNSIYLAIINEDIIKVNEDEIIFDTFHLNTNSPKAIRIKAKYKINKTFFYNNIEYEIIEILDLQTHLYRYILNYSIQKFPNNNIEFISASSPEELIEKIQEKLSDSQKRGQLILDQYNFKENQIGFPISGLLQESNDISKYSDAYSYLIYTENQFLYTPQPNFMKCEKYVLTISALLFFSKFKLLKTLEGIKEKIYIPKYTLDRINSVIHNLNIEKEGAKGTLNLYNNQIHSNMRDVTTIAKELSEWIDIADFIEKTSVLDCDIPYDALLNQISNFLINDDKFSIDLAYKNMACLIIDDLFISRTLELTTYNNFSSNSSFGLIYSENLLDPERLINLIQELLNKKYYPVVNADILYTLVTHISSTKENMSNYFSKFCSLLHPELINNPSYSNVIREFIDILYKNQQTTLLIMLFNIKN